MRSPGCGLIRFGFFSLGPSQGQVIHSLADSGITELIGIDMKLLLPMVLSLTLFGCASQGHDADIDNAYRAYQQDDCGAVMLHLSSAERRSRFRPHQDQPEVSLLRGLCLERQALYLDAAQIYRYLQRHYPHSEYSYRAGARLETLRLLGHYDAELKLTP